jgi:spore germination cell wall hydrolase CwlJ-like protein
MTRILFPGSRAVVIVAIAFAFGAVGAFAAHYAAPSTEHIGPSTEQIVSVPLIYPVVVTPRAETPAQPTQHQLVVAQLESEHRCLSEALYYEARGEGAVGQRAVAEVIFNRLRQRAYPHSICGIVNQGAGEHACQFAFACDGERARVKIAADWAAAETVAAQILTGELRIGSLTGDALYFRAAGQALEPDGLERTIQIGNQVFFRDAPKSRAS